MAGEQDQEQQDTQIDTSTERITPESLEASAKSFFASLDDDGIETVTDDDSDTDADDDSKSPSVETGDAPDGGDGGGDDDDSSPLSSPLPDSLDFGEKGTYSRAEIENLLAFQAFVRDNPGVAQQIAAIVQGQPDTIANPNAPTTTATGKPYSQTVPEGLDLDDPSVKALWDEHIATRTRLDQLQPMVESATQALNSQKAEQAGVFLNRARDAFAKEYDLTPEDVARVQTVAGNMNILPAMMSPIDPITGLPRVVDPLDAIASTFKTAYALMPEFEAKRQAKYNAVARTDQTRKKKLSSLAGSSGSVPKSQTPREPKTANERRNAMIQEVAATMFGVGTDK